MPESEESSGRGGRGESELAVPEGERRPSEGPVAGPQVSALAGELSDHVVDAVGWLKARTTLPVVTVLRAVVFGLVVVVALITATIFVVIGLMRIWDAYLPLHPLGTRVWLGYVALGALLVAAGTFLLVRRNR